MAILSFNCSFYTLLINGAVDYVILCNFCLYMHSYVQNTGSLEDFKRLRTLGAGSFGRVILCQHLDNHHYYAIKVLDKAKAGH